MKKEAGFLFLNGPIYKVSKIIWIVALVFCAHAVSCQEAYAVSPADNATEKAVGEQVVITRPVTIALYFQFMDSLISKLHDTKYYPISEHILVHTNPYLIQRLADTDYYRLMARDTFVYNQRKLVVLKPGDRLIIPDASTAMAIENQLQATWIDVNIPEFRLRIYRDSLLLYTFPIRVGQNRNRYLKIANRLEDLRTRTGIGSIVGHNRFPDFYNPVDGKRFYLTRRDDGKTTLMPQIPWIDTSVNGIRYGQMIHPTTNPETLGKAYSNGCIGLDEASSWIVYYHAPIGTRIRIRYELQVSDQEGNNYELPDIYGYKQRTASEHTQNF